MGALDPQSLIIKLKESHYIPHNLRLGRQNPETIRGPFFFHPSNPHIKLHKVLSNPSFKLIGLGFKKGQVLEKHVTPTPAILIIQTGSVDFNMSGKTHMLKAGDFFEIPANTEHEVVGKEDSHLYLIK